MPVKFPLIAKLLIVVIVALVLIGQSPSYTDAEDDLRSELWETIRDHPGDAGSVCCRAFIDSIRHKKVDVIESRTGSFALFVGLTETGNRYRDTINGGFLPATKKNYYFLLPGYYVKPSFDVVKRGGRYEVIDIRNRGEGVTGQLSPGAVRYMPDLSTNATKAEKRGSLMVPLSFNSHRILKILFYVLMVAALLYALWVMLVMPILILLSIARGKSFTKQTVKYLFIIGGSLVGFVLLSLLVALISQLLLANRIPEGIFYSYYNFIVYSRGVLITGLIVLLLAIAFRKGLEIKEHNDHVI
jgi:hypothetical protein